MKRFTITLLLSVLVMALGLAIFSQTAKGKRLSAHYLSAHAAPHSSKPVLSSKLLAKAAEASRFARSHHYNERYCFLIDMSLPSGSNRFLVYDLQKDTILHAGLVTHGNCMQEWLEGRRYGNTPGCGCTSLGKYRIGNSYTGRFGLAFKLYGLEPTNSNAFARYVVLHSHECVPEGAVMDEICQSNGCPTVSPGFLKILAPLIRRSKQPILLWIYS